MCSYMFRTYSEHVCSEHTLSNVLVRNKSEQIVPDEDAFELLVNSGPNYLQFKLYSFHRIHILVAFHFPKSCG